MSDKVQVKGLHLASTLADEWDMVDDCFDPPEDAIVLHMACRWALQVRWEDESKGQVQVAYRSEFLRCVGTPKRLALLDEDVGLGHSSKPVQAGLIAAD